MTRRDRRDAGRRLAERLVSRRDERPVLLALPRGGVPVAHEVARALGAPLDVLVVRTLGAPRQPELGVGAIGEGGVRVVSEEIVAATGTTEDQLAAVEARERAEIDRRARAYRGARPMLPVEGRTVVIVDDGIATGGTARAAIAVARAHGAARVIVATPVAPPDTVALLEREADEVVTVATPTGFAAIGEWYDDFSQTTDDEVVELLDAAFDRGTRREEVDVVRVGPLTLAGTFTLPPVAVGVVVFAHGSGSSRHSPRNRYVAERLVQAGLGTLLLDLLTPDEELEHAQVFDVDLLVTRLRAACDWVRRDPEAAALPLGLFGASTGAAAALATAAADPTIAAGVSRGGRPDLAGAVLGDVQAPTLLVVGGDDTVVLGLNERAAAQLRCEHRIEVIPGATHLFEEPGTLEQAAALAAAWFTRAMTPA
ncbi:MAG: phosphoribosyltransferase family protein [Acidimicrobiia bacterium]